MWVHIFRPLISLFSTFWVSSVCSEIFPYLSWIFILLFYLASVAALSYHCVSLSIFYFLKIPAETVKRKSTNLLWGQPNRWVRAPFLPVVPLALFARSPLTVGQAEPKRNYLYLGTMGLCYPGRLPAKLRSAKSLPSQLPLLPLGQQYRSTHLLIQQSPAL